MVSVLVGCAGPRPAAEPALGLSHRLAIAPSALDVLIAERPCPPDRDVLLIPLGDTEHQSIFLVQLRTREPRHVHALHDLTISIYRGQGAVMMRDGDEDRHFPAKTGDVFHIPRGTVHYAVANPGTPLIGVAIFSPRYKGQDNVPMPGP